jgi:uncharacterized protein YigE (DUF2233 family)
MLACAAHVAMHCSWSIGSRWFAALSLLAITQCAQEEAAPLPATRVTPAASSAGAGDAPALAPPSPAPPTAPPVFQALVPGLSTLADERIDAEGGAHEWIVTRVDLHQHRLQVRPLPSLSFADLPSATDLLVAVNSGFFSPKLEASGLLISQGRELAPARAGAGSGVVAVVKKQARLLKRGEALPAETDFAVQCGPRLIEPGGGIGIRSDDGQRAARTAVCIREQGRELDLVVSISKGHRGAGPSLLQLAQWLAAPLAPGDSSGCDAALNLDGGPSTGIVVAGKAPLFRAPLGPVPFALVVAR